LTALIYIHIKEYILYIFKYIYIYIYLYYIYIYIQIYIYIFFNRYLIYIDFGIYIYIYIHTHTLDIKCFRRCVCCMESLWWGWWSTNSSGVVSPPGGSIDQEDRTWRSFQYLSFISVKNKKTWMYFTGRVKRFLYVSPTLILVTFKPSNYY